MSKIHVGYSQAVSISCVTWLFWETPFTTWIWHRKAAGPCRGWHPSDEHLLDTSWKLQTSVRCQPRLHIPCILEGQWVHTEDVGWRSCGITYRNKPLTKKRCLVRAKRQSQRDVLRGAMRWLFHGRTMSRRCSASERPLKTDSTLLETTLAKAKRCWKILPGDESNKAKGYIRKLVQEKLMMGQISIYLILL